MKEYKLITPENVFTCFDIASHICLVLQYLSLLLIITVFWNILEYFINCNC